MKRLCVFCGSRTGVRPIYALQAQNLGQLMAARGIELVFGGGHIGLMGVIADAVLQAGGKVIGVIPRSLVERELAHPGVTEMHIVETMHERKAKMAELSDAFVALPGAYGTADEMFEILTWAQLGIHSKPAGILNTDGFFAHLLSWLDHASAEGFLKPKHRDLFVVQSTCAELLDALGNHRDKL